MKDNLTDISVVLDRSGSMEMVKSDTIGGFNAFVESQKKADGDATLTLAQFDNVYDVIHEAVDIQSVPELTDTTFVPRGMTALLDAIGRTINSTGARLKAMDEADRPGKVIFVILTDGAENASREFTRGMVNEMIKTQTEQYNWDFVFLGANQDAIATGASLGISRGNSIRYSANAEGTQAVFGSVAESMCSYRSGDMSKKANFFTGEDRDKQAKAGA